MSSKPDFRVIAFYTEGTPYEQESANLKESLVALGLPHVIVPYKNLGSWVKNCGIKPTFIREMLRKYGGTVMYVDVDAVVRRFPKRALTFTGDMAAHYRQRKGHAKDRTNPWSREGAWEELLSGTLIFRNGLGSHVILNEWIKEQHEYPGVWDQRTLQAVVERLEKAGECVVHRLPPQYTMIFDTMRCVKDPVVEHFMASRRLRKKVNDGTQ